jgi:soluble lytic murein transglycosylase-like protein
MRHLRGTYVQRREAAKRRRRVPHTILAVCVIALTVAVIAYRQPSTANAENAGTESRSFLSRVADRRLREELENTKGELNLVRSQLEWANKVIRYSTMYAINVRLATDIYEASVREGIDPELAFRLVGVESEFNDHAISKVGALGLTQLMPSTAVQIEKGVTREQLFQPRTNLRIGFRYLRSLLELYKGDVRLALLAYNRGEDAVWRDMKAGINPGNGYDRSILKGYTGKGLID